MATRTPQHRYLPLLLILFAGSGCAALIYEIVWFQMLQLVIGSSAVSLGVLLGTFMGGMCIGSLALPRLISRSQHPLRVYALMELAIGIIGILALFGLPLVGGLYAAWVGSGFTGILLRGALCAVCLLPPTLLMGATIPAISRWIDTTPEGVSWLGFFYGGNIGGAVVGSLLAGFYLLRLYDTTVATCAAALINLVVASVGLLLARITPACVMDSRYPVTNAPTIEPLPADPLAVEGAGQPGALEPGDRVSAVPGTWSVYAVIALSGLSALGAEVVWTRLLGLLLGGTVYTFSIILAVFLVGLGLGSSAGSMIGRQARSPGAALGACQLLLGVAIYWAAYSLSSALPFWPIDPRISFGPWVALQLDLVRCAWTVLPAACLWGASFPLALAAASSPTQDPARLVSGVYAANTLGAIAGSLAFSIILIPAVGTAACERILIGVSALGALLALASGILQLRPIERRSAAARSIPGTGRDGEIHPGESPQPNGRSLPGGGELEAVSNIPAVMGVLGGAGLMLFLMSHVTPIPGELVAYGRQTAARFGEASVLYMGEGMNSSIAVTEDTDGTRNFHVSGKIEASNQPQDMRLQRMLGHLPALLLPAPRSVLVVGCGAGVTAGTFTLYPSLQKEVICELEPLIPHIVTTYFKQENYDVVENPKVRIVYDDARHYVLTTPEKFDIITSDPIHPWVKGSAALYSEQYFRIVRDHLNPGGLVTQWVPLYESNMGAVKSEVATFFKVFPNGTIWSNDTNGEGYDIVLMGSADPSPIDVDRLQARLKDPGYARVASSLKEVGFKSAVDLLSRYGGQASDLQPWLRDAAINSDSNLRLQYLAGLGLNDDQSTPIYGAMLAYRRFSPQLFVGAGPAQQTLRRLISSKAK